MDIQLIKALGYFKLFKYGKKLFNNLDVMYEHACMASAKEKYWSEIHHIITNYNDHNYRPLSNLKIR